MRAEPKAESLVDVEEEEQQQNDANADRHQECRRLGRNYIATHRQCYCNKLSKMHAFQYRHSTAWLPDISYLFVSQKSLTMTLTLTLTLALTRNSNTNT